MNQFTNGTHPAVAQMVDIVGSIATIINHDDMPDYFDNVLPD